MKKLLYPLLMIVLLSCNTGEDKDDNGQDDSANKSRQGGLTYPGVLSPKYKHPVDPAVARQLIANFQAVKPGAEDLIGVYYDPDSILKYLDTFRAIVKRLPTAPPNHRYEVGHFLTTDGKKNVGFIVAPILVRYKTDEGKDTSIVVADPYRNPGIFNIDPTKRHSHDIYYNEGQKWP